MEKCLFNAKEVTALLEHAQSCDEAFPKIEGEPGLWLVYDDDGVYLMSAGYPQMLDEDGIAVVTWAEGMSPGDPGWEFEAALRFPLQREFTHHIPPDVWETVLSRKPEHVAIWLEGEDVRLAPWSHEG